MKLETVSCNHCGAPLEVGEKSQFVTCRHCSTQLAIIRTSTTSYTEEVGRVADAAERLNNQLANMAYQDALEKIDRDWARLRKKYVKLDFLGGELIPSKSSGMLWILLGCGPGGALICGFLLALVQGQRAAIVGIAAGIVLAGAGLALFKNSRATYDRYQRAKFQYLTRREALAPQQFLGHTLGVDEVRSIIDQRDARQGDVRHNH